MPSIIFFDAPALDTSTPHHSNAKAGSQPLYKNAYRAIEAVVTLATDRSEEDLDKIWGMHSKNWPVKLLAASAFLR